ncbi:COPIA protein, partial [Pseudoatta argentina]
MIDSKPVTTPISQGAKLARNEAIDSTRQRTVALSSMEAEYMAISDATKEAVHLRSFILVLSPGSNGKITLYSDNIGAIKLAENPVFHNRSKHIDVRHHFVRGIVDNGEIELSYKSTEDMAADILTKGLPGPRHR